MGSMVRERQQRLDCLAEDRRGRSRITRARRATEADAHSRPTLDELITGVWEGLAVRGVARCPLCDGQMVARSTSSVDHLHEGGCQDCGTTLS